MFYTENMDKPSYKYGYNARLTFLLFVFYSTISATKFLWLSYNAFTGNRILIHYPKALADRVAFVHGKPLTVTGKL